MCRTCKSKFPFVFGSSIRVAFRFRLWASAALPAPGEFTAQAFVVAVELHADRHRVDGGAAGQPGWVADGRAAAGFPLPAPVRLLPVLAVRRLPRRGRARRDQRHHLGRVTGMGGDEPRSGHIACFQEAAGNMGG